MKKEYCENCGKEISSRAELDQDYFMVFNKSENKYVKVCWLCEIENSVQGNKYEFD